MFARISILIGMMLLLGGCATRPTSRPRTAPYPPSGKIMVRTTAYTHSEPGGNANGVGGRLRFGGTVHSAASDWSWMPLGTRFRICSTGREYVIEDYGSALVGRKTIDLYFPSRRAMNQWGCREIEIEIIEWGSASMSLKLLEGRMKNKHVRQMVAVLRSQQPLSNL